MLTNTEIIALAGFGSFNGIANERNLFEIFFKPKLKIEFDKNQLGSYKPELNIVDKNADKTGIKRKWLKIKIRNKGSATAINCRAKIHVIEGDSSKPTDTKRLIWDEFASTMDIYPKDDGEFCHVVFSDTKFPENIACMISSEQAEKNPEISAQNGLGAGKYKIQITVTAENQTFYK